MDAHLIQHTTDLNLLLHEANPDDLDILVDYVTDRGKGRLALDGTICKILVRAKQTQSYGANERAALANEILEFGGNTLGNAFRRVRSNLPFISDSGGAATSGTVPYDEIVGDVASHLGVKVSKGSPIAIIEEGILRKMMGDAVQKMTDAQRQEVEIALGLGTSAVSQAALILLLQTGRMGGFATYKMAAMVANASARALLGRGLPLAVNSALSRTVGVALGPIGWALTAAWTLADLSSPAYRVTVPCVVHIAYMRTRMLAEAKYIECPACHDMIERTARFCPSCGAAQGGNA